MSIEITVLLTTIPYHIYFLFLMLSALLFHHRVANYLNKRYAKRFSRRNMSAMQWVVELVLLGAMTCVIIIGVSTGFSWEDILLLRKGVFAGFTFWIWVIHLGWVYGYRVHVIRKLPNKTLDNSITTKTRYAH
ncbi:MAG: hypothetical protein QXM22_02815 [Candidatus Bathyarchaeia archaeon]